MIIAFGGIPNGSILTIYQALEKQNCVVEYPHGRHVKKISGTYILDNHSVNLLSSLLTSALVPYLTVNYFWSVKKCW